MRVEPNAKQREVLAQFYSNFALAWITFGLVTPVFNGVSDGVVFGVRLVTSIVMMIVFLSFSLSFLK